MTTTYNIKEHNMHILITGATGGLGGFIIKELHKKTDIKITAHGRDMKKLESLQKTYGVDFFQADISTSEGIQSIYEYCQKKPIDVLINNAGVLYMQDFATAEESTIQNTINVNISAMINLTRKILPLMLENNTRSNIINIGSTAGSLSMPYLSVYCATKYAVKGFSEGLHRELYDTPVYVSYVAPRGMNTSMLSERERKIFKMFGSKLDQPENVAKRIVCVIEKSTTRTTIGLWEKFGGAINSIFPSLMDVFFWIIRKPLRKLFLDK